MPTVTLTGRTAPTYNCPPNVKEVVYWSDELSGFGLRCRSGGARSWYVQYRTKAGQMRKHTLGDPQSVPFVKAQKEAARLLAVVKLGGDPADVPRAVIPIRELVTAYLTHQKARMKGRSYAELARHLETHAKPLHKRRSDQITRRDAVVLLQDIAKTAPVASNRVRASLSAMFAWGMKAGLVTANPIEATFKPAEERPRERVLADQELRLIWSCTGGTADHDRIVRLLMLTGARREEIGAMQWSEITVNEDSTAIWVLPSRRSKNHLAHELALPTTVVELLPPPRNDENNVERDLMFGEGAGPFSGWSRCKARLDTRIAQGDGGSAVAPWVLHDLRRTFVTRLNDLGVEPHIIEALVNHTSGAAKAGVAGIYNRSAYAPQKRAALMLWCDHIGRLTSDGARGGASSEAIDVPSGAAN